ncbi:hypothetical protein MRB53_036500 [Persea americana]|nr:hypothetical protein MRB53_036500 [Persea americana]
MLPETPDYLLVMAEIEMFLGQMRIRVAPNSELSTSPLPIPHEPDSQVLLSEGYSAQRNTSPSAAPPTAHATWKPGKALSRTIEDGAASPNPTRSQVEPVVHIPVMDPPNPTRSQVEPIVHIPSTDLAPPSPSRPPSPPPLPATSSLPAETTTVITDSLAAIQCPVSDEDKVLHILSGLGPSYEMFVTSSVCAKPPMPTFEDLRALLLNQEIRLSQTSQSSQSPPSPPPDSSLSGTAMFSQRGRGRGVPGRGRSRGYRGRGRGFYNPGRGPNSYYGRGYVNPGRGFYSFSGRDSDYSSSSGSSFAGPPDMGRGFRYPPHLAGLLGPGPASSPAVACQDLRTGKQIARGNREGDLYVLRQHGDALMALTASAEPSIRATDFIWHSRLGHPRTLQFLRSSDAIYFSGKPKEKGSLIRWSSLFSGRLDVDYLYEVYSLYEEIDSFIFEVNGESSEFQARGKQGRQQSQRQGKEFHQSKFQFRKRAGRALVVDGVDRAGAAETVVA